MTTVLPTPTADPNPSTCRSQRSLTAAVALLPGARATTTSGLTRRLDN